jgi:hypothetical protein
MGKDIFSVWLYENRIHPWGSQEDAYNNDCITNPPTGSGYGCSAKYLYQ